MTIRGYERPLYLLPFDHRGSFETGMFGWKGALNLEQTAQIADAKQSTAAKTLRYLFSALMALIMALIAVVGLIWSMFAPGNPSHH